MQMRRCQRDQAIKDVNDLAHIHHQMSIVENEQKRRLKLYTKRIDDPVHYAAPGQRSLCTIPSLEHMEWQPRQLRDRL